MDTLGAGLDGLTLCGLPSLARCRSGTTPAYRRHSLECRRSCLTGMLRRRPLRLAEVPVHAFGAALTALGWGCKHGSGRPMGVEGPSPAMPV